MNAETQKRLIARAVRALGVAPTKLICCPILFLCEDCDQPHVGVIVGWRCVDGGELSLTVQAGDDVLVDWRRDVPLDRILYIGREPIT